MSDPNKYVNIYIDTMMATLHEYLASSLQLKTQLKLANDLLIERDAIVSQKDEIITQMNNEIERVKTVFSKSQSGTESIRVELLSCQDRLRIAEESHDAIKSKVSHMDTLLKQLSDMKSEIRTRDDQISSYEENLKNLNSSLIEKDKLISELTKKLEKLAPTLPVPKTAVEKNVKESSTIKVQLNTKTKTKEPDDDF